MDLGYSLAFNFPENHLFRGRSTTPRVNELDLNMGGAYVTKEATPTSRWGMELLAHGGQDAKDFGFASGSPKVGSSDQLRHFGRANVSYLAPIGKGLRVQAGLFESFIGYESLYAKDNFNYTRAWVADYSPYLMFGVNVSYPLTDRLTGSAFVINEYAHLAHTNDQPSYGAQLAWTASTRLKIKQTVYYGPDQAATAVKFWRLFSDTVIEWIHGPLTVALDYQIGTENLATVPGNPRTFCTGAAAPVWWRIDERWGIGMRPEVYWDRNGRLTGSEQLIQAMTATVQHRRPIVIGDTILRLEYRVDQSTGVGGGFFSRTVLPSGEVGLASTQHLVIFSVVWLFSSPA